MQPMETASEGDYIPQPLTGEEEDALVQLRILSDERALRKVVRKFYTFAFAVAPGSADNEQTGAEMSLEEAREQLLAEIATFNMHLQKSALICQAEARQVMEYEKEKERILNEQEETRQQIEILRATLDEEQRFRKQKIEYDSISEKINTFPTRFDLESSIKSTQEEIVTIQEEKYNKDRMMHARKIALDQIVSSLELLRQMDKEPEVVEAPIETQATEPDPDGEEDTQRQEDDLEEREDSRRDREREREARDNEEEGEEPESRGGTPLNPTAKPFQTRDPLLRIREEELGTPSSSQAPSTTPSPRHPKPEEGEEGEEPEDVEMAKQPIEELEEGEASDGGSLQATPAGT